jgi:hypothetical protein
MLGLRRLKAMMLLAVVLAAAFILTDHFVQEASASDSDCSDYKSWCCGALANARKYCGS